MRPVSIYSLSDPRTGEIRYVGKTIKSLGKRRAQHVYSASCGGECHRDTWIRSLLKEGLKPNISLIELTNESEWDVRERYWIAQYRLTHNLTNYEDGGDSGQIRPKGMNNHKVVYSTEEIRQACSLYVLGCSFEQIRQLAPFKDLKLKILRNWAEKKDRTDETIGIPRKSEYQKEVRLGLPW